MAGHLHTYTYDHAVYAAVGDELLGGPRHLLEQGVLCKNGSRGYAARVTLAGQPFFLKQYYAKAGIYRLVDFFRGSRGWRTWKTSICMYESGVVVPKPLTYLEERKWGVWRNGYLLSEFVAGEGDLHNVWLVSDSQRRRELVQSAGRLIAGLHRRGFVHGDLKWNNILCSEAENGKVLVLSDLDGTRRCRVFRKRRMAADVDRFLADFISVGAEEDYKQRFMAAYKAAIK